MLIRSDDLRTHWPNRSYHLPAILHNSKHTALEHQALETAMDDKSHATAENGVVARDDNELAPNLDPGLGAFDEKNRARDDILPQPLPEVVASTRDTTDNTM